MKKIALLYLLINLSSFSQSIKELETTIEMDFDFGIQVQNEWKQREQLLKDLESEKKSWDNLTAKETKLFERYDETYMSMWDIEGAGCSWYCGAGDYTVTTSSELAPNGKIDYKAKNLTDFSYQTAWVEGKNDYGIGEKIEFVFAPNHPRVTTIKIANGYVKSTKAWKANSRVKKLKLSINDEVYGIIHLKDTYALQAVKFKKPIGYADREDYEKLKTRPKWKISFEILEVYKGEKYKDTVISEIFFDGIDVH
ncbi:NADase-type glycan-binding domain-containing protein [Tenacibaculum agarivorans]|uniref:NADase-type glycan-binding domain-containing protein n=1 Tax=Tenacibaculum agarivorans TaxID=1908389 RepID=UPI000A86BABD|nr:hypothetical protein [Tenacibaculum agarivorans]